MAERSARAKVAAGVVAGVTAACAIGYTVYASREAMREVQSDREIAEARRRPEELGYFSLLNPNRRMSVYPAPAGTCSEAAMEDLQLAVRAAEDDGPAPEAPGLLRRALQKDPACVAAGRLLMGLLSRDALQVAGRDLLAAAKERPGDPAAQLLGAYYERSFGDADAYRKRLEAASALRADQPLLHAAWAYYWGALATPSSMADQLRELEAEVRVTGDLGAVAGLVVAYQSLREEERALEWCDRFYAALPDSRHYALSRTCAVLAFRSGTAEQQQVYRERFRNSRTVYVDRACMHADLSWVYSQACRSQEALAEAQEAIATGCARQGEAQRRRALLALGRWSEAAAPPSGELYWGAPDRFGRALAQAMTGDRDGALETSAQTSRLDAADTKAAGTSEVGRQDEALFLLHTVLASGVPATALASAAGCETGRATEPDRLAASAAAYVTALMPEEALERADRALRADPRHGVAWQAKVYALSVAGRLDEAAAQGERALAMGVVDPSLFGNLGYVYEQQGSCERAVPLFRRARELRPLRSSYYGNLAKCLDLLGRGEEADEAWRFIRGGRGEGNVTWPLVGLGVGALALYLAAKFALIKLLPARFGHLKFP